MNERLRVVILSEITRICQKFQLQNGIFLNVATFLAGLFSLD